MAYPIEQLFIALYTDADVHGKLAAQIRAHGFDAVSTYEAGQAMLDDWEQLDYATSQQRTILTCNARHFAPLYQQWWQAQRKHYGIIVSQQVPVGEMLRRVLCMLNQLSAGDLENGYRNLAEFSER